MKMYTFFLICLKITFFHLVLHFRSYKRYLHVSQKEKISTIYSDLQMILKFPYYAIFKVANIVLWVS